MQGLASFYATIARICGGIAAALVLFVTLLVASDVIGRNLWRDTIPGDIEFSEYAMLLITTFAAPWLLWQGQHVRIDTMLRAIPARLAWGLEILCDVIGFITACTMAYYATRVVIGTHAAGSVITKEFIFPEWWFRVPLAVMFAVLAIGFIVRFHAVAVGPRTVRAEGGQI